MPRDRTYWASKSGLDLADECFRRVERYYNNLQNSFMYQRWARSYRIFYGLSGQEDPFDISKAGQAGDQGQLTSIKVNHSGNLARHSISLISQTVPDFEPIPTNADHESLEQVDLAKRVLNYYMDTRGVGDHLYDAATAGAIFGFAKLIPEWDPLAGAPLKVPVALPGGAQRKKTGDLIFNVFTPLDLVFNRFRFDNKHDWFITRRFVNRYDLAARYPGVDSQLADEIIGFNAPKMLASVPTNRIESERSDQHTDEDDDLLPMYTLFHRKSDALQAGKYACFLSKNIMLYEGNLPYDEVPDVTISPGKILRSPYGESGMHHVMGMQDTYDNVASSITTNNVAAGTQIIMVPEETDYSIDNVLEGLAILRYKAGPEGKLFPQALNLTAPNEEGLKYLNLIRSEMETVYGVPATMRGAPQPNVDSGSFGALISQQALTYMNAFQYSFQRGIGKTGDIIIAILKQYADQGIMAEIAGQDRAYEVVELTKDKLSNVHRVVVKSGNPASRTPEFNQAMAEKLLQAGVITDAKSFITMVRTGDIDTMVDPEESALMNIRRENELLAKGINPPVLATDDHHEHLKRNKQPLDSPAARNNPKAAQAVLAHLQQHITMLKTVDPELLMALGQTPLAPPAPPPEPPGVPGAQPGPNPPPPPPPVAGAMPKPPGEPINPLTHKPWTPQDGGLPPH